MLTKMELLLPLGLIAPITPKGPISLLGVLSRWILSVTIDMNNSLKTNQQPPVTEGITAKKLAILVMETYDTIDHWAGEGLLPYRKKGRIRFFSVDVCVARCKQIREMQNQDFNLAAIRHALNNSN